MRLKLFDWYSSRPGALNRPWRWSRYLHLVDNRCSAIDIRSSAVGLVAGSIDGTCLMMIRVSSAIWPSSMRKSDRAATVRICTAEDPGRAVHLA